MSRLPRCWKPAAGGLLLLALCACVVTGAGYDGDDGGAYVGGVYEEPGYVYGGWGSGYHVGPPRGRVSRVGDHRAAPSIPTRSRGRR
jgi:hypothetical protein